MSNIRQLPPSNPEKIAVEVDSLRRALPHLIEHAKIEAKIRRARYLAYIAEGFTPREALDLIRSA